MRGLPHQQCALGNSRTPLEAQGTTDQRPTNDNVDAGDSGSPRTPKFPRIEDIPDLIQKWLNQMS